MSLICNSTPIMKSTLTTTLTNPSSDLSKTPGRLSKKINNEKDVIHFKTVSPAYNNVQTYIDSLCELIHGTGNKILNHNYTIKDETYKNCSKFLDELEELCDSTDLDKAKTTATLRFGHVAFRDWYDAMREKCVKFIHNELATDADEHLKDELLAYLTESFGNRMRIDYGTGHELNFIIFTMGLAFITGRRQPGSECKLTTEILKSHIEQCGWDILALFAHKYLRMCRNVQKKFRLEPAGSRGVYNMDDFQFLPFLFGAAQLIDVKYVSLKNFYDYEQVDMWKSDFIFFEAIDYILKNKRGPFNEHSYTLWGFTSLGSWSNIFRRIKVKFNEEVLSPYPIVQHLLFGEYILRWNE